MADVDDLRALWDVEPLRGLWDRAREALEAPEQPPTFRLELPDEETRQAVGEVYGRPMWGYGTRISVSKLDTELRENSRFGLGLVEVLEILHDRPIGRRESDETSRVRRRDRVTGTMRSALANQGLDEMDWSEPWTQWVYQYGRISDDEIDRTAGRAAGVLAELLLDREDAPSGYVTRADLSTKLTGDQHQLDDGSALTRIVLHAAAMAHQREPAANERERRELWESCGVTLDAVSATVLCWALPVLADDAWSASVRERTELGLPTHVTHQDLSAAPDQLVAPGTAIAVCENARVLEAAAREDIRHPVVCLSGQPSTVAVSLLNRLAADGAELHHHGDFDWTGVNITRALWSGHGVAPWRMSAADYRESLNQAAADRTDLPNLVGEPTATPWDPELSELMATAARAVEEETVLPTLLDDLRERRL